MTIRKITRELLAAYRYLSDGDDCVFLSEYTAGAGYSHGKTNDLISNLKKSPDRKGKPEWHYKEKAIREAARMIARLKVDLLAGTIVPIPPSAAKDDPAYDDRLIQILNQAAGLTNRALDIRELIIQTETTRSSSRGDERLTLIDLRSVYRIDESKAKPSPIRILLFDDLISTGCHFAAAKELLARRFPRAQIRGLFLARNIHPDD